MKTVKSPLIIERIIVLHSEVKTVFLQTNESLLPEFDKYVIDLDYTVKKTNPYAYRVFVKGSINNRPENQMSGYSMFAELMLEFSFSQTTTLPEDTMKNYVFHSGLVMGINNLRNYLMTMTSQMIFGHYILPSIDLGELRKEKNKKNKLK